MSAQLLLPTPEQPDPMFGQPTVVPLGTPVDRFEVSDGVPSRSRPFGLRFAVTPAHTVPVDVTSLGYDPYRQIGVDATGEPVYGKHSTGRTSTQTSDGHQGMDPDSDYTED